MISISSSFINKLGRNGSYQSSCKPQAARQVASPHIGVHLDAWLDLNPYSLEA
jgi:hypothetical protein